MPHDDRRPLSTPQGRRQATPFAVTAVAAAAAVLLPPAIANQAASLGAVGLILVIVVAGAALPWGRWAAWTESLPAFAFFAVVVLLRHAQGGGGSDFGPITVLPIFWLALFGTRRLLYLGSVTTLLIFIAPLLLIGAPDYPVSDWRRAGLWVLAALFVGPAVQGLVDEVHRRSADLELVGQLMRELPRDADVRDALCRAARESTAADFAVLMEETAPGLLTLVTTDGVALSPMSVEMGVEPTAAGIAFLSHQPYFVPDMADDPEVSARLVQATGARSGLFQPLRLDGRVLGVLVLGWCEPLPDPGGRVRRLAQILALDAANALARADLVARLDAEAKVDPLTGTLNRRQLSTELHREIDRSERTHQPLSVAMLDLDHFKIFNDTFGHPAGDRLLTEFATAIKGELRSVDVVARYGGEEFLLLLPSCGPEMAAVVANRVRRSVPHGQTCSLGVATYEAGEPQDRLIARADAALYRAKREGRDRVALADARLAPVARLDDALR